MTVDSDMVYAPGGALYMKIALKGDLLFPAAEATVAALERSIRGPAGGAAPELLIVDCSEASHAPCFPASSAGRCPQLGVAAP